MFKSLQEGGIRILRWSERYTKTDMVYLAKGGFWLTVGQGGAIALSFSLAVAFGHLATQDAYGNYKYVLTLAGLLGALSLSGIPTALIQSIARGYDGALRQGFWLNLRWSLGISVVSLLGSAYYFLIAHNNYLGLSLIIIAAFTPFLNGLSLYDSFLIGKKKFRQDTFFYIFENALLTVFLIAVIFLHARAIVLVLTYFVVSTGATALFYFAALRQSENNTEDPSLFSYSGHLSVINTIGTIVDKIDSVAVFTLLGPVQLAVYSFAIAIPEQMKGMIKNINPLSMPRFAERSIADIKRTLWKRIFVLTLILVVGVLAYIVLVPFIFEIFFPVYLDSIPYSRVYAFSVIFITCTAPLISILQAHKKTRELYITTWGSAPFLILLLPVLTLRYGIWGAVISQFIYRGVRMSLAAWQFIRIKE